MEIVKNKKIENETIENKKLIGCEIHECTLINCKIFNSNINFSQVNENCYLDQSVRINGIKLNNNSIKFIESKYHVYNTVNGNFIQVEDVFVHIDLLLYQFLENHLSSLINHKKLLIVQKQ